MATQKKTAFYLSPLRFASPTEGPERLAEAL